MATTRPTTFFILYFLFFSTFLTDFLQPGFAAGDKTDPILQLNFNSFTKPPTQGVSRGELRRWKNRNSRRLMIGSTAPTCTYNECRGCRYKCKAEQIPVDANDPINSAYHYKCVCHR
ncbi:hypothetical protein AAC387_Pa08g2606 [Persea americana]